MYDNSLGLLTFTHPSKEPMRFPLDKIKMDSYKVKDNSQDFNSFRNIDGILVRNALATRIPKVTFQLKNQLTEAELDDILSKIESYYVDWGDTANGTSIPSGVIERKIQAKIYVPTTRQYVYQYVYLADPEMQINRYDINKQTLVYDSVGLTFIGYGENVE